MTAPQQAKPIEIARRGLMLVISSPSGAGKSTIARNLLEADSGVSLSVSVTTRQRRPSEIAGRHYHFIDRAEFEMLRDSDALLEWAEVHGNFYGTPRKPVEEAMAAGRDMLFDIDWQGAQQLQEKMAADVVSIFILPPSMTATELCRPVSPWRGKPTMTPGPPSAVSAARSSIAFWQAFRKAGFSTRSSGG